MVLSYDELIHDPGCPDLDIPECQSCPLPACRFEMGSGVAGKLSGTAALRRLLDGSRTIDEAARELGVSRRTAYRWLERR
jgi:transposase-like protein